MKALAVLVCQWSLQVSMHSRIVRFMLKRFVRPIRAQHVCLASCLVSGGLAIYFWTLEMQPSAGLAGPWYWMIATVFSACAAGALACWTLAVLVRRRTPKLADGVAGVGSICGFIPPFLTAVFTVVFTFG
jgi:peptidoglycan/LPS O-acetylase OafA/YrhL